MKNLPKHIRFTYGKNNKDSFTEIERSNSIIELDGKVLFEASFDFLNKEDAELFASQFPKYCKIKICQCSGSIKDTVFGTELKSWPCIWFRSTKWAVNDVTAEFNESGAKKHDKIIQILKQLGY